MTEVRRRPLVVRRLAAMPDVPTPEDPLAPEERGRIEGRADAVASLHELHDLDRSNRVGRTLQQLLPSAAVVTILEYVVSFARIDLAPLDPESTSLPTVVTAAAITLGTWWQARRMNRAG